MADLNLTLDELKANVGQFLGIGRDPTVWDTDTADDVDRIIRSGRRRVFSAHDWEFLQVYVRFVTSAPQETGTITIVDGVVTLTGATWPSDAATNWVLAPDSEGVFEINTRDTATQLTLHDTSLDVDAGTSYSLYQDKYDFPSDNFAGFVDPITLENNTVLRQYASFPEYAIRMAGSRNVVKADQPELFNVLQTLTEETGVPAYKLQLYPLPDAVYVFKSRYRVQPGDALGVGTTDPVFHSVFSELLLESVLSAAEVAYNDNPGAHTQRFQELLPEAIKKDRMMRGTRQLPPRDLLKLPANYQALIAPITYETI